MAAVMEEPRVSDEARIPIGIAADMLGIARSTLLIHTKNGYIRCGNNKVNGRKFYLGRELKRYWRSSL